MQTSNKKIFKYRGFTIEELNKMSLVDFSKFLGSRLRRKISRGLTHSETVLLEKLNSGKDNVKTHARDMPVLPIMVGKTIKIYNGKEFKEIKILNEMLGHRLGEFSLSRAIAKHGTPGVGASKSKLHVSMK